VGFETFGIILIEAFRQGTPVLARRLGPFPEILEKAGAGLLFADQHELVDGMQAVQRDPGLRREWSARTRRAFSRYWSESAVVPRYLEVVRQAAERTGRRRIVQALSAGGTFALDRPDVSTATIAPVPGRSPDPPEIA
jgi:hypothetical protein